MKDIVSLRTENTKTYDLGSGKRGLLASVGACHYLDNYADKSEQWKDIDLTWEGNRIIKAPYELTLEDKKLTIKDKKSAEVSTIELMEVKPAGLKYEIIPEFSAVRFRHILPSDKIPFEAKFKITGKIPFLTGAQDDEGELPLETTLKDGILTEKLSSLPRPAKGNIRIDPTWQVTASTDDVRVSLIYLGGWLSLTSLNFWAGYNTSSFTDESSAGRFLNITIPAGSLVTQANLILTSKAAISNVTVNTRIRAERNINPATFSEIADFLTRTWTTAYMNWDAIPAWTLDAEYTSPSDDGTRYFKDIIQEVIDLPSWASGNPIVILWDDFQQRSTQASGTNRNAYSYDGSTTLAPKLYIEYTPPAPKGGSRGFIIG